MGEAFPRDTPATGLDLQDFSCLFQDLLSIIASVLHLGNVQFTTDEHGSAQVTTENQIKYLARVSDGICSRPHDTLEVKCTNRLQKHFHIYFEISQKCFLRPSLALLRLA